MSLQNLTLNKLRDTLPEPILDELRQKVSEYYIAQITPHQAMIVSKNNFMESIFLSDSYIRIIINVLGQYGIGPWHKWKLEDILFVHSRTQPITFTYVKNLLQEYHRQFERMGIDEHDHIGCCIPIQESEVWKGFTGKMLDFLETYVPEKEELWTLNAQELELCKDTRLQDYENFQDFFRQDSGQDGTCIDRFLNRRDYVIIPINQN